MADITISDLELAPALTDDMVLPVENTTDTYAATLAMLRRLINKTFVEVENADFNALTDDGFYQCTGTPTNSPVAGAINWTLQVSAESGVVVQRAFSLDDSFANMYIRRWNGVSWTGWLEVGAGALANKANTSLSNLDATGQAKFDAKADVSLTNSPYTTNRILEIPQDIKLELNNGTLTLKAGSKVYVPNGPGTFNAVTIASDVSIERTDNKDCIAWYNTDTGIIQLFPSILFYSGTTAPSGYQFMFWYDTTNNKCKVTSDSGSTWLEGKSFPICVVSTDGTKISAIKQIFNGFGYIGSTTFILPGVKWQRCAQSVNYGKNADGTNASVIHSTSSVLLVNHPNTVTSTHYICVADGGSAARYTSRGSKIVYYDESKNAWYNESSKSYVYIIPLLEEHTTAGRVDSFTPYSVDSVANSNASNFSQAGRETIVGWGMPNYNASVEITASVAAGYTATYKQCVVLQCTKNAAQSSNATITINNIAYNMAVTSANNQWNESNTLFLILDVGDTLKTNSTNAVWYIVAYPLKGV